ncbi:unnamed protein product [Prorocentrum cordatum]|uniref:Uncharacterized protein n=1 Tax=Prorocentrum cordatum TaxID=2364126 RepID=A0ABN9VX44_9DINO|nr:unnamed protein product [Polarella glacialis]
MVFQGIVASGARTHSFFKGWWLRDAWDDLKNFVVWTAVFLPTLLMASLLSWPCVHTQMKESREQWLAWGLQMECGDQTGYLSVLTVWGFVAAGPLTWLGLVAMSNMFPPSMLSFLVGGYKERAKFWEVVVLLRRCVDAMVIVLMPLTYAAFSQTLAKAGLMAAALSLHAFVRPYDDPLLNLLEFVSLFSNTISVILTAYVSGHSWSQTASLNNAAFAASVVLLVGTGFTLVLSLLASLFRWQR